MIYQKSYSFNLADYEIDEQIGHVVCVAEGEGKELHCSLDIETDLRGLTKHELREIEKALKARFEDDFKRDNGPSVMLWPGDRKSPLLRLGKGDKVTLKDGEAEVVYAIPESDKIGVRVHDGRVLNFTYKSLEHFLFKKG